MNTMKKIKLFALIALLASTIVKAENDPENTDNSKSEQNPEKPAEERTIPNSEVAANEEPVSIPVDVRAGEAVETEAVVAESYEGEKLAKRSPVESVTEIFEQAKSGDDKSAEKLKTEPNVSEEKAGEATDKTADILVSDKVKLSVETSEKNTERYKVPDIQGKSETNTATEERKPNSEETERKPESVERSSVYSSTDSSIEKADDSEVRSGTEWTAEFESPISEPILSTRRMMSSIPVVSEPKFRSNNAARPVIGMPLPNIGPMRVINDFGSRKNYPNELVFRPATGYIYNPFFYQHEPQLFSRITKTYKPEELMLPEPRRHQPRDPMSSEWQQIGQFSMEPSANSYPYVPPQTATTQKPFNIFSKLIEASENPVPSYSGNFYKPYDPYYNSKVYDPYGLSKVRRYSADANSNPQNYRYLQPYYDGVK